MARDDGFAIADTDTGKLNDPKFRRLWRRLKDEAAMNAAVVLHDATLLASWAEGERVSAEDAAPAWLTDAEQAAANLHAVGLLDESMCIPAEAWESWFGAARDRRQRRRDAGLLGGRPKQTESNAEPLPNQSQSNTNPVPFRSVPSVPSDPGETSRPTLALPVKGMDGSTSQVVPRSDLPADTDRLQRLAEELTGVPYVLANLHGQMAQKIINEQLRPHRWTRFEKAWREVAARFTAESGIKPTLRQLALAADDLLNPIPRGMEQAGRQAEEQARFDRRVAATKARLRGLEREPA